jgi:hypothetical protein
MRQTRADKCDGYFFTAYAAGNGENPFRQEYAGSPGARRRNLTGAVSGN